MSTTPAIAAIARAQETHVSAKTSPFQNHALYFASDAMKSEAARVDAQFVEDFVSVLSRECFYHHNFISDANDKTIFRGIVRELNSAQELRPEYDDGKDELDSKENNVVDTKASKAQQQQVATAKTAEEAADDEIRWGLRSWSKHCKFDEPEMSPTFSKVVAYMAEYFHLDIYATRLNYYKDGQSWKTKHHDSHAYGGRALREDFTAGVSFGATRDLAFHHDATGRQFAIPQTNSSAFAFTGAVNKLFMHSVPKAAREAGPRLSIIVWGRRRGLTERNGGGTTLPKNLLSSSAEAMKNVDGSLTSSGQDAVLEAARSLVSASGAAAGRAVNGVTSSEKKPAGAGAAKKKKNRLQ